MPFLLLLLLVFLLCQAPVAMDAARASCLLFARAVMPGLYPYLVLALMLVSRLPSPLPSWALLLCGWCGGSPTGARLLAASGALSLKRQRRLAVQCATMSPMFLLGTVGAWLNSPAAGRCALFGVLAGGYLAGLCVKAPRENAAPPAASPPTPITFGAAVESAARTMLLVCGTMCVLRVFAALLTVPLGRYPMLGLIINTLLEVTCGVEALCALPLPLALRAALAAGAAGFGGASLLLQNRAVLPEGVISLPVQMGTQLLHGALSFLLTLGAALMLGI